MDTIESNAHSKKTEDLKGTIKRRGESKIKLPIINSSTEIK